MTRPPLRARLQHSDLTSAEKSVLEAMCEHCSDGSYIFASIPRIAAYSKLTRRHVDRLIKGYIDPRSKKKTKGLVDRGILTKLAEPNWARKRPATYRINADALHPDPKVRPYLEQASQQPLPGMLKPSKPAWTPCPRTPDTMSTDPRHRVQTPLDTVSTDPKAFDSDTTDPKAEIHHGDAALNSLPAWLAVKEQLRSELSPEEWDLWVRPMLLLKTLGAGNHILAALPPNGRIIQQAQNRLPLMRELLAPAGLNISLTRYPDEWEISEAQRRYGIDIAPKPWSRGSA